MTTSRSITWQILDFARLWETGFKIRDSEIQNQLKMRLQEQPKHASEISRLGQHFARPMFSEEPFYTPTSQVRLT